MKFLTLAAVPLLSLASPALAQEPPKSPANVLAVRTQIDDLGLLKALTPLKLTPSQIAALLPPMKAASKAAEGLRKADDTAVLSLAADVSAAFATALKNEPISPELEKKIAAENKAAADRLIAARKKAVGEILSVAKEQLTTEQKTEIEKQCIAFYGGKRVPKAYADKPDKAPRDIVLDLAVQGFIEQIFLLDRTITLLEKIRDSAPKS